MDIDNPIIVRTLAKNLSCNFMSERLVSSMNREPFDDGFANAFVYFYTK